MESNWVEIYMTVASILFAIGLVGLAMLAGAMIYFFWAAGGI